MIISKLDAEFECYAIVLHAYFRGKSQPGSAVICLFGMKAMSELYDILDLGYVDDYLYVICSFSISMVYRSLNAPLKMT